MSEHEPIEDVTTHDTSTRATVARAIRDAIARPGRVVRELNRLYHRRLHTRRYNPRGIDVFAEDWDNLVVLDACRYDTFEAHHTLPGRLESRISRGSDTYEFLVGNVDGRSLPDTVYVTSNPRFFRRRDDLDAEFHAVLNVWGEGWDEEAGTVLPETTTEYAMAAQREYPNKRLVVHYMQPHAPFLEYDVDTNAMTDERQPSVWDLVLAGELDPDEVRRAYVDNLELCLPHLETLLGELRGRTVVTADHGNMLGEPATPLPIREWGHPLGIHTEALVRVPWLVHDPGPLKRDHARPPGSADRTDDSDGSDVSDTIIADRLEQLGYRT